MSDPTSDEQKKTVLADLDDMTRTSSETARYIAFGLLAVYFSLRISEPGTAAGNIYGQFVCALSIVGLCGVGALLCDVLQYLFGAHAAREASERPTFMYRGKSIAFRARSNLFTAKQWLAGIGSLVLVGIFAFA